MIHPEYVHLAHRKAVWALIQNLLMERYITGENTSAASEIICEEVPLAQKVVKETTIMEILEELELKQEEERRQMMQFEMRRRSSDGQPATKEPAKEGNIVENAAEPGEAGARATGETGATGPGPG